MAVSSMSALVPQSKLATILKGICYVITLRISIKKRDMATGLKPVLMGYGEREGFILALGAR
jgi:hypothetical protein